MNRLQQFFRRALCVPIRVYQHTLSPWIGRSCRFTPSCSNYTMQAIMTHGCIKGILLGAWRIARCNPLGKWGFDPVPEAGTWSNPKKILYPAKLFAQAGLPDKAKRPDAPLPATLPPARKKPAADEKAKA